MGWFIAFIIIFVLAGLLIYKTAEVHELHKLESNIESKKHDIHQLLEEKKNDPNFNWEYYQGESHELDEIMASIQEEIKALKIFDI